MTGFAFDGCRHIAIEGVIGVGKTTLARRLAAHLSADLFLEKPQDNPFLERFYADPARYAFQAQMYFLFQRVEQYRELAQPGMFGDRVVSDFVFAKDAIFARLTLNDEEYGLYVQMHRHFARQIPEPDLVLWLQAGVPTLQERIARRGIAMEQGIEAGYLDRLHEAYVEHFRSYTAAPVLAIDTEGIDPAGREEDFRRLLAALRACDARPGVQELALSRA
ncbi:MAG TPA: deoxynucleoside kinase [Burkholderiaceae bacterium]|nr:deoxynucleoside kinase [Burkholderiaceae bacterium]